MVLRHLLHDHSLTGYLPSWIRRQKLLTRTGIDPMPLAFKASTLALEASGIEPVPLAFKASVIPVHHWCYTTLLWRPEYDQEVG